MWQRIKGFAERHRGKITVLGVAAGCVVAWKYIRHRIYISQEKERQNIIEAMRRKNHYEATERTADAAILAMGTTVADVVCRTLDTGPIILRMQQLKHTKGEEWRECWNQMKFMAVSRVVSMIYCDAILCVLLRVKLAVIAGHLYLSNNCDTDSPPPENPSINEEYLSSCQRFISDGVPQICKLILSKVTLCPGVTSIQLNQKLSLEELEKLLWSVQTCLCEDQRIDPLHNIPRFTSSGDSAASTRADFATLEVETNELLISDEVWTLISSCVSRGMAFTVDTVASFFVEKSFDAPETDDIGFPKLINKAFAKIIPLLDGIVKRAREPSNERKSVSVDYIHLILTDEKLKTLSANIYEAFASPLPEHKTSNS